MPELFGQKQDKFVKEKRHWWTGFAKNSGQKPGWAAAVEALFLIIISLIGVVVLVVGGCMAFWFISNGIHK
jgi:flagellar basal body-associated protein FliL